MKINEKTKKATFRLHSEVLAALDKAISEGVAPSKNVFVERALLKELKEVRRRIRHARWKEGAKDPVLLRDISAVEIAFHSADLETTGKIV